MARLSGFVLGALLVIGVLSQMDSPAPVAESAPQPMSADGEVPIADVTVARDAAADAPVDVLPAAQDALAAADEDPVAMPAPAEQVAQMPPPAAPTSSQESSQESSQDSAQESSQELSQGPAPASSQAVSQLAMLAEPAESMAGETDSFAVAATPGDTASEAIGFFEEDVPLMAAPAAVSETAPEAMEGPLWEPVWQAFAARRSAEGFSQRLASLTGLDYRVEKLAPGRYQVEVGYASEPDRALALSRIEQATGLVLAGSDNDSP